MPIVQLFHPRKLQEATIYAQVPVQVLKGPRSISGRSYTCIICSKSCNTNSSNQESKLASNSSTPSSYKPQFKPPSPNLQETWQFGFDLQCFLQLCFLSNFPPYKASKSSSESPYPLACKIPAMQHSIPLEFFFFFSLRTLRFHGCRGGKLG